MFGCYGHLARCFGWFKCCEDDIFELLTYEFFVGFLGTMCLCIESEIAIVGDILFLCFNKAIFVGLWDRSSR